MEPLDYNPTLEFVDYPVTLEDKIRKSGFYLSSYLEYDERKKEFVRHVYASRYTVKNGFECMEVFREYESGLKIGKNFYHCSYGGGAGLHIVWRNTNSYYYGKHERTNEFEECNEHINVGMFHPIQITTFEDIVVHDLNLRYCKWNKNVDALNYIKQYKKYPIVEMLMSLELYHLVFNEKCILFMMSNKSFCRWLFKNKDGIKTNQISFPTLKTAFKNGKDVVQYNSDIIQKRVAAKRISDNLGKDLYRIVKNVCRDFEKLEKYASKVGKENYRDYLEACEYLKLNLADTKVLYPKKFKYWHDFYINQMNANKNNRIDRKISKQAQRYKYILLDLEELILMFPTKTQDFIDEGKSLHHCVGRMSYNEKMANGESLIIFIRKKVEPSKPYVTMEFDPKKNYIKQIYGDHDKPPSTEVKNEIYNNWLPMVKQLKNKQIIMGE